MSLSILNNGTSGGLKPELIVTAPSGSTIDLLQNGVIIDTYTLTSNKTEHVFIVEIGNYAIQATLGAQIKSVDILVDFVRQYSINISFPLYLYTAGNECTEVTGGWYVSKTDGTKTPTLSKLDTSLRIYAPHWSAGVLCTNNNIDTTNYSTCTIKYSVSGLGQYAALSTGSLLEETTFVSTGSIITSSPATIALSSTKIGNQWLYFANSNSGYFYINEIVLN